MGRPPAGRPGEARRMIANSGGPSAMVGRTAADPVQDVSGGQPVRLPLRLASEQTEARRISRAIRFQ